MTGCAGSQLVGKTSPVGEFFRVVVRVGAPALWALPPVFVVVLSDDVFGDCCLFGEDCADHVLGFVDVVDDVTDFAE